MSSTSWPTSESLGMGNLGYFWGLFSLFGALGSVTNVSILGCVALAPPRLRSNPISGILCTLTFATLCFCLPCSVQCFVNFLGNDFMYGQGACDFEAIYHWIGIFALCYAFCLMSYVGYAVITDNHRISRRSWKLSVGGPVVIALYVSILGPLTSESVLYDAPGWYCLYAPGSVMGYHFWIIVLLALLFASVYYTRIFMHARRVSRRTRGSQQQTFQFKLARKLALFVCVFLVGLGPAACLLLYNSLLQGRLGVVSVSVVGFCSNLFSIVGPLSLAWSNPAVRAGAKAAGRKLAVRRTHLLIPPRVDPPPAAAAAAAAAAASPRAAWEQGGSHSPSNNKAVLHPEPLE